MSRALATRATPWLMLAPALAATALLVLAPVADTLWMSVHDVVLFHPLSQPFVGLANYARLAADPAFWHSLGNSLIWVIASVSLQFALGFAAALLLNRRFAWRGIARGLIVVPWALPGVLIALIWSWMLDFNLGVINTLAVRLGLLAHPIAWLAQPDTAMAAVILALVWQGFPFFAVTLLAGLQSIPSEHYEAAALDGAGRFGAFIHVTLPGLSGVIATAVLLRMIWVANSLDVILVMTGGGPGTATETLPLYAFLKAWTGLDYGYGSALAVVLTLLLLSVVILYVARAGR
ncbi:MAG TPA: sugar ABC transporter permease [Acetobacteraceae bacterium]|nr:sugar ABC transporter permease [Acetobacteraceae bacterium]